MEQLKTNQRFNEVASLILEKLYDVRPCKIAKDPENFYGDEALSDDVENYFFDTLDDLISHGYVGVEVGDYLVFNEKSLPFLKKPNQLDSD